MAADLTTLRCIPPELYARKRTWVIWLTLWVTAWKAKSKMQSTSRSLRQLIYLFILLFSTTHCSLQGLLCDMGWTFQHSPPGVSTCVTTREHPAAEDGTVGEMCPGILPKCHVTFRDPLHAVTLRHGTDGFTSPPKEGMLRIFSP
jgi:hypothetical protein